MIETDREISTEGELTLFSPWGNLYLKRLMYAFLQRDYLDQYTSKYVQLGDGEVGIETEILRMTVRKVIFSDYMALCDEGYKAEANFIILMDRTMHES